MGKMFNSMVLGMFVTLTLALFNGSGIQPTSLVLMLLSPAGWETSAFWSMFMVLGTVGVGIISIGIGALLKQDWIVRAGWLAALSTIVINPFIDLARFFVTQTNYISTGCVNSPICSHVSEFGGIGQFLAIVIAGPIILYVLWACVEWVFKGDGF